jgi:hypothetical protein
MQVAVPPTCMKLVNSRGASSRAAMPKSSKYFLTMPVLNSLNLFMSVSLTMRSRNTRSTSWIHKRAA